MSKEFDDFKEQVDYDIKNVIDSDSWKEKKIYDESPFLVLPNTKFNIKIGALLPKYVVYIRKRAEQFGDAVGYDLTDCTINLIVYGKDGNAIIKDTMQVTNKKLGEVTYTWKPFDLQQVGFYTANIEVILPNNGGNFILPNSNIKAEIIVI